MKISSRHDSKPTIIPMKLRPDKLPLIALVFTLTGCSIFNDAIDVSSSSHFNSAREWYADDDTWLDACISKVRENTLALDQFNSNLPKRSQQLEKQLEKAVESGDIKEQRKAQNAVKKFHQKAQRKLTIAESDVKNLRSTSGQASSQESPKVVAAIDILTCNINRLRALIPRIPKMEKVVNHGKE
jgi:hypothetical protein